MALPPSVINDIKNRIRDMEDKLAQWDKDILQMEKAGIPTTSIREDYNIQKNKISSLKSAYG